MNPLLHLAGKLKPETYYKISALRYRFPFMGWVLSAAGNRIRNRDGVIQQGLGKGLKFNVGNSIAGYLLGTQEPHVQATFARLVQPKMVAYDLGANVGFLSLILCRLVGPQGQVVSFDPVEENTRRIGTNADLNKLGNIQIRTEAVGKGDGQVVFRLSDFPTTGKLEALQHDAPVGIAKEVAMRSLDSVIDAGEAPAPDFIKMDIEGGEVDALRGASKLLAGKRPIFLIELHATNEAVDLLLSAANYRSLVIGSRKTILESHWNVQIVSVPAERPLASEICEELTNPDLLLGSK